MIRWALRRLYRYWRASHRAYNARRRELDIKLLWPSCKSQAPNMQRAREAFRMHTILDAAWIDLSDDEINSIVDALP
jgi:hypothetical protein